ncbi:MAG: hypothetical protein F6K04_01025 [Leptolyngbya sp. SIO4C5]|nr:hypothetical protein [Leptolyngbya sp. SIO4C5]
MEAPIFTAITFSPVTEFIEKTRKLRDLYGSSFILSYLADSICRKAEQTLGEEAVVSPVPLRLPISDSDQENIILGTPDQIVVQGDFPQEAARAAFDEAWDNIMDACQQWVRDHCQDWIDAAYDRWVENKQWERKASRTLPWDRDWQQWKNHAWEFFWVQEDSIPRALDALNEAEADRNWVGINWIGESSTLSGADAIAWPGLDRNIRAKQRSMAETQEQVSDFFQVLNLKIGEAILNEDLSNHQRNQAARIERLREHYAIVPLSRESEQSDEAYNRENRQHISTELAKALGEAIITNREQLNIPELTKRLSTLRTVAQDPRIQRELPKSFKAINLWKTDNPMGWFRGDGDQAGSHIRRITQDPETAADNLRAFSGQMRRWARGLMRNFDRQQGRIIFAGGDDFLGVFFPNETPAPAVRWLCNFKEAVWHRDENGAEDRKPVTPSVGFVWASPQVPQRDVLQHCEKAEQVAKKSGRDRVCLRVLFASGTHVEWTCPWWFLPKVVHGYRDRNGQQDWTHFYKDVAELEARHAFDGNHQIALSLFNLFIRDPQTQAPLLPSEAEELFETHSPLWTQPGTPDALTGILDDGRDDGLQIEPLKAKQEAFNNWVISLAEVGFQLFNQDATNIAVPANAA